MAKKSQKRPARHERDQSGCMWGFISMFDFRHGRSSQKLLSDRRHGTRHIVAAGNSTDKTELLINLDENSHDIIGGEKISTTTADACKSSVKKLMEDEMLCQKDSKKELGSAGVELKLSNSEYEGQKKKNRKRTNRSRTKSCEIYVDLNSAENLESEKRCLQCSEKQSANSLDMDNIVEEFCHQIHRISCLKQDQHGEIYNQPNQKNPEFEDKVREAIELFVRHRLVNGKHGTGHGDIHPSKELKDALRILGSDKELSLQLIQCPMSVMIKYVEDLSNSQIGTDEVSKPLVRSNLSEQEIHDSKQTDEVVHGKQRKFFRRKAKALEKAPSKGSRASQASNRIVILKPGPTGAEIPETEGSAGPSLQFQSFVKNKGPDERVGSYFFLSEIKRKLKQAIGKDQQEMAPDGISKRISDKRWARADSDKRYVENVGRNSPNKDHFFIEKIARPSVSGKKGKKTDMFKECEISTEHENPRQRVSNIYVEAKKHLFDMLSSESEPGEISSRRVPKTLGRILSLPEYNFSPISSPGRDWAQSSTSAQTRFSVNDRFHKQENNVSHLARITLNSDELCVSGDTTNNSAEDSLEPSSSVSDEVVQDLEVEKISCSVVDGTASEDDGKIIKASEIVVQEEINVFDSISEASNSSMTRDYQNGGLSDVSEVKGCSDCFRLESHEEVQPSLLTSPPSSSNTKDNDLEGAVEALDRPSPVSVLEPLFTEDDISPARTRSQPAELPVRPLIIQFEEHGPSSADLGTHLKACIQDKESVFDYIKAVLEASEVNWDEFYIMSNSSDPLLDPSVYDEVGFFPNQLCYDKKLLFDCINEVLMDVYGKYFGCPLGLSFGKPTIRPAPDMINATHEVWEGVHWCLLPLPLPRTLEQTVKKDMAKTGSWMDLRYDSEIMVIEMGEFIFNDLIEEIILSRAHQCAKVGNPSTLAELKD